MANLAGIISAKTENDQNWRDQRQAERDNTVAIRDGGIAVVATDPDTYGKYLILQGDNPTYSAGNIVLCLYQLMNPTLIGTKEKWKSLGRYVKAEEQNKGAKIFVRPNGINARGYNVGDAYDIEQTQGREVIPLRLENDTPQMEKALATLLNYSPVEVVADSTLDMPALYNESDMVLTVNPDYPDDQAFSAIATEIALARMHNKGRNQYYDRENSYLDADSISFIICRRFGVERELPDASNIAALNGGMTVDALSETLNTVQEMAKKIGGSIELQISPPQRTQNRGNMPRR